MPPLDPGQLFRPGSPDLSAMGSLILYVVLVVVFAAVFIASVVVYAFRRSLYPGHSLHVRLASRFATIGIVVGAVGLILLIARLAGLGFLSMPIWLVLAVIALLVGAGYVVWFIRARYPAMAVAYQAEEARRRFIRPSRPAPTGGGGSRRRSKKHRR